MGILRLSCDRPPDTATYERDSEHAACADCSDPALAELLLEERVSPHAKDSLSNLLVRATLGERLTGRHGTIRLIDLIKRVEDILDLILRVPHALLGKLLADKCQSLLL